MPGRGWSEEARAATRTPAEKAAVSSPDGFLGALSFTSGREPIAVTANALEFDYRAHVLTYKGAVVATQGDMKLESETLTVALGEHGPDQLKEVVASGNVRLSKGQRRATAGHAVFDQTRHTVVLSENAVLQDGPNQITGQRVMVYLDEERSVVEGGSGRVQALLFPPQGDGTPGAARDLHAPTPGEKSQ